MAKEKAKARQTRVEAIKRELSSIPLIQTPLELKKVLEVPRASAEVIKLIKAQMELRGKRLFLSCKRRKKTIEELEDDLVEAIMVDLRNMLTFDRAIGKTLQHCFKEENDEEKWYDGEICEVCNNIVTIHYSGDEDT